MVKYTFIATTTTASLLYAVKCGILLEGCYFKSVCITILVIPTENKQWIGQTNNVGMGAREKFFKKDKTKVHKLAQHAAYTKYVSLGTEGIEVFMVQFIWVRTMPYERISHVQKTEQGKSTLD